MTILEVKQAVSRLSKREREELHAYGPNTLSKLA